jgi:hypothetical protein
MSGTGGTSYDPTPPLSPCERLTFRTVLNSPVPHVIMEITDATKFGRVVFLDIELIRRDTLRMAIASYNGKRAGAITADALARLLECMESGFSYHARVESIAGARVEVQVESK